MAEIIVTCQTLSCWWCFQILSKYVFCFLVSVTCLTLRAHLFFSIFIGLARSVLNHIARFQSFGRVYLKLKWLRSALTYPNDGTLASLVFIWQKLPPHLCCPIEEPTEACLHAWTAEMQFLFLDRASVLYSRRRHPFI